MIQIEVDRNDVRALQLKLRHMQKKAPGQLKNAINKTATATKQFFYEDIEASYTVKKGRFKRELKVQRASAEKLDATITVTGRPLTIRRFKTSAPRSGGRADIVRGGLKNLKSSRGGSAFVAKGGRFSGLMVQRESKDRDSVKVLKSNSVPKMTEMVYKGEGGAREALEPKIQDRLHKEIDAVMRRIAG